MITYILIAVGVLLLICVIAAFNSLSKRRNQIENAISSLDALFIQRSDLIPNLIATTKEYMAYEQDTLRQITELRRPVQPTTAENPYLQPDEASTTIRNIMLQAEAYPELRANSQFVQLQHALSDCEEQLAAGRRYLSASITDYNDRIVVFPSNVIASLFGFKKYEWQYATEAQRQNVDVAGLFSN